MSMFLSKVLGLMSGSNLLTGGTGGAEGGKDPVLGGGQFKWVWQIVDAIKVVLWPILVVVGAAGLIYSVVLGVNMAKADSTEKREEAKKRLINVVIGLAITIGLILFFLLFIYTILPAILGDNGFTEPETGTNP